MLRFYPVDNSPVCDLHTKHGAGQYWWIEQNQSEASRSSLYTRASPRSIQTTLTQYTKKSDFGLLLYPRKKTRGVLHWLNTKTTLCINGTAWWQFRFVFVRKKERIDCYRVRNPWDVVDYRRRRALEQELSLHFARKMPEYLFYVFFTGRLWLGQRVSAAPSPIEILLTLSYIPHP